MEKIQPEEAMAILARHGTHVTEAEAQEIINFLYVLGTISLNQFLNNEGSRLIYQGKYG